MMNITQFADLLVAARAQEEPQRLLLVFAAAELPKDATPEEAQRFANGEGGALKPVLGVDKLPQELADGGYLPKNTRSKTSTILEDPFHPGHTYKYAAPENYWMNGSKQQDRFPVWVPIDFPSCQESGGRYDDTKNSPLAWAVWSLGPRPDKAKAWNMKAPLAASTWYRNTGGSGVIARYKQRDGATWSTVRPLP